MRPAVRQSWDVFLSYAHASGADWVTALHHALEDAGVSTFLDADDESNGEGISQQVFDALLGSRVVVVFADATYFTRRYCAEELSAALTAYRALARRDVHAEELFEALEPVVIALPARGEPPGDLELLPPEVRSTNWPLANETQWLATLVRDRLAGVDRTIGQRLLALGELVELRGRLLETVVIPVPKRLSAVPVYHESGMPPSLGDGFVGRVRELWELHEALAVRQGGAAALTTALEGGGGFGKTRLALEYLHRYGPLEYPGGLFWVNADVQEDQLQAQQHGILRLLKPDVPELAAFRQSGRDAAWELGAALREVATRHRVLYVVDNVPEPSGDQLPQRLSRWCPAAGHVSLLLTSRTRLTLASDVRRLQVRELPPLAAMRLLQRGYDERGALPEDAWRQVVTWVGEWPLALELLNASLQAGAVSPGELLEAAKRGPTMELERQIAALRGAVAEGTLRGVADALQMPYHRLPEDARMAARQLALLAPNPIPIRLVAGLEPRVRVLLRVRSFVSEVRSGEVEMYGRMHRVLADFLRGQTEGNRERETRETCDALLEVMTWEAAADPASWPMLNAYRPHVEAIIDRHANAPASVELAERLVELCRVVSRLLRKQGQPATAVERNQRCVELAERSLGPDHLTTVTASSNLAWALRRHGQLADSRRLYERVVAETRGLRGEEHPDTLLAMRGLALAMRDQGELGPARALQERILEVRQRIGGEEHPDSLWDMSSLALTLRDQGETRQALTLEERVLQARRRTAGPEHPETVWAMYSLAQTLRIQGDLARAAELEARVLAVRRLQLGDDHPDTLLAVSELAITRRAAGELERAIDLLRGLVEARRRLQGDEHPETQAAIRELDEAIRARTWRGTMS